MGIHDDCRVGSIEAEVAEVVGHAVGGVANAELQAAAQAQVCSSAHIHDGAQEVFSTM